MAIDQTQTLQLTQTPVEIVATLSLTKGEYRIENAHPQTRLGTTGLIRFLAAATQPDFSGDPSTWGGHALAAGAREDIGIETGQKWYFWSPDESTLVITRSEAGGAIGGSPPTIRHPSFHVDIFAVFANTGAIPTSAPVGGAYTLATAQLTPPTGWQETQQTLQSGQVEAHSRAIIDPNTTDPVITPIWSIPQQVNLIGTITGISTTAPLAGSGTAGSVALSVQNRGITSDFMADDSVGLRSLEAGTAGNYIGFDAQGDPAELTPHERINQLDVPAYEEDKVLGIQAGNPAWVDLPTVPRDIEFFYGHTVPTPVGRSDIWFVDDNASGLAGVYESDATTPRTRILKGDVYEWRPITGQVAQSGWVWQANVDSAYGLVTESVDGIMRSEDKTKLDGIEAGAEVNVQADWNITNTDSDAYIHNKPTIPAAQVQADWSESTNTEVDFIKNKPTQLSDFDAPAYANNDGRALGLSSGSLAWIDLGSLRIAFGTDFPANPGMGNHFFFTGNVLTGLDDYVDSDGTTAKTSSRIGDIATYNGTNWQFSGSVNTQYTTATRNAAGLMSGADKSKLDGIESGAEANVKSNWAETDSDSEAFIQNKPTIPTLPGNASSSTDGLMSSSDKSKLDGIASNAEVNVQADWSETTSSEDSFIKNKPDLPNNIPDAPTAGAADAVYELQVATDGVSSWQVAYLPTAATITAGGTFPGSPNVGDLHFATADITSNVPSDIREADGTTTRTAVAKGDIYEYELISANDVWVLEGNLDTDPPLATGSVDGLLSSSDFTKIAGIAAGAEVNVQANWSETTTTSDAYIQNKPTIPAAQIQSDWNQTTTTSLDFIKNKPTIPDAQIHADWDQTDADEPDFIENKPTIPTIPDVATDTEDGLMSGTDKAKLDGIASGAEVNVQVDWNQTTTSADDYIKNKPTITTPVQSNWGETDTADLSFIQNKPTIPTIPSNATTSTAGLMSSADKTKLDGIAEGANQDVQANWAETDTAELSFIRNKPTIPDATDIPDAPSAAAADVHYNLEVSTDGTISWQEDTGGGANSGEQNVQADWTETSTGSDAFIRNKPSDDDIGEIAFNHPPSDLSPARKAILQGHIGLGENEIGEIAFRNSPGDLTTVQKAEVRDHIDAQEELSDSSIGDRAFSNPPTDLTDTEKTAVRTAIGAGTGSGGGGLSTVSTDATITGDGSSASPLSVANPFTDADETKLDGIATGAEVNVQADWDETDTDADSYIDNKPDLNGRYVGDFATRTAYNKGDVVFSTGQFWRAKQDVPDNRTGAPTNDLDYWQQSTFSIGMVSTLPVFVDNDEFNLNRDRWVIMTADQTLTGTRDGTGPLPYVADLQDSRSISEIQSNQITQLNRGDMLRVDTWPTRYWARMMNAAVPNVPNSPAAQTEARNYNLQVSTTGVASWQQDTGGGGTNTGEANVQSDWNETNTASDAFILNKPTIPSIPTDEQIGDKAFTNPPGTLTNDEQEAVRTAIGAGTGSGTGTLTSVATNATITGDGTTASPLAVANPFTDADETKLDGIAAGAEVNVQPDWNATSGDGQIANKPTIPDLPSKPANPSAQTDYNLRLTTAGAASWVEDTGGGTNSGEENVQADWNETDTSDDSFIRNKPTIPTIPGNATDSVAGLMSALDKDKLDSIASSAEVNVQADWNTTNTTSDSYIQNKPTIPTLPTDEQIGDKAFSNPPTDLTDAEKTAARNAIGAGTTSGTGGEENVQSDWNVTDTNSDAFILNKPTIPTLPTDSQIGDKAFSNPPTDLDDAEQANVRTNIGLTNSNIGVLAFRNPPSNLTSTQQTAVRTAIGAGTGSGGTTTFALD